MNETEFVFPLGVGGGGGDSKDPFGKMFDDTTIDIQTGELLGRYIAEERDSGRILRACYEELKLRAASEDDGTSAALAKDVRSLRESAEAVSEGLEELRREVSELRA